MTIEFYPLSFPPTKWREEKLGRWKYGSPPIYGENKGGYEIQET
jgi:hypothetical protein